MCNSLGSAPLLGLPLCPSAAGTEGGQHPIGRVLLDQVAAKAMPSSGLERSLGFDHLQVAGPGDHFKDPVQGRRVGAGRAGVPRRRSLMVAPCVFRPPILHTLAGLGIPRSAGLQRQTLESEKVAVPGLTQ